MKEYLCDVCGEKADNHMVSFCYNFYDETYFDGVRHVSISVDLCKIHLKELMKMERDILKFLGYDYEEEE